MDETTAFADLVLPSHTYLESWGDDFPEPGVGFPVGAVSQPVVSPLYDTRATGDIILGLAQRLGFGDALPWTSMQACVKQGWREIHRRGAHEDNDESFETFWNAVLQSGVWGQDIHREAPPPQPSPARGKGTTIRSLCIRICPPDCTMVAARTSRGCKSCRTL
jgi:anaerobic selenocysteine-containing dehydrogenase